MSDNCNHDCSSCSEKCASKIEKEKQNEKSKIKKVIGVVSGKGGVGKSLVTSLLASKFAHLGFQTAILDADVTGPSIPKIFGIKDKAVSDGTYIYPAISDGNVKIMSVNLLLENEGDPVVWRGPVIAGAVKQFWTDVAWNEVDYMFVDMPPGTGDVPLTVFQSLPIDGIVVVTSPQSLVSMIVSKAVKMAELMNVPVLGIVENMAYFECPNCGEKHTIFGESNITETAKENNIEIIEKLPINPHFATLCDNGLIDSLDEDYMPDLVEKIKSLTKA